MAGSFDYNPQSIPLGRPSAYLAVYRFTPADPIDAEDESVYELLSNVVCLGIQYREGADPGVARFRYKFGDPLGDPGDPARFEEVYPLDATGPRVVNNDDRLVVRQFLDDGSESLLFDGFAQIPQADLDRETESVSFSASGTPVREWDTPLPGALTRDVAFCFTSTEHGAAQSADIQTDLPARFNPDGHPNATQENYDSGEKPAFFPVFIGPNWPPNDKDASGKPVSTMNNMVLRNWTLGMAVRYILTQGNSDQEYVKYGDLTNVDKTLQAITPTNPGGTIDFNDPTTYTPEDVVIQDYDVTGELWPVALERLLTPQGWTFRFVLDEDPRTGDPSWRIFLYRKDNGLFVKGVNLQQAGNTLDPGQTNVGGLKLARDSREIVNAFVVDTSPVLYEASFVLAPGFPVDAADYANRDDFKEGSANFDPDKYRLFVFDECGEYYWDVVANQQKFLDKKGADRRLDSVLDLVNAKKRTYYTTRRRPGRYKLLSIDPDTKKPYRARLHVSTTSLYKAPIPGVWDGVTGAKGAASIWQEVHSREWTLLDDRLGIRITCKDPDSFSAGVPAANQFLCYQTEGRLSLVQWIATPTPDSNPSYPCPVFLLTCVIEGDQGLEVTADRREVPGLVPRFNQFGHLVGMTPTGPPLPASPTKFTITRVIDAKDRFKQGILTRYSILSSKQGPGGLDEPVIDDSGAAQACADGYQRAHELGSFAGSVTIPRLTTAYSVGDKIGSINGRGVSLRQNVAAEQGESPVYPSVVAISWELDGNQSTHLELSDSRAEPAPSHSEAKSDEEAA